VPPLNAKDTLPRVAISLGAAPASEIPEFTFETKPPAEYTLCKSWSLDFDLQQLGDPFSVEIDNADGRHTGKFRKWDEVGVYLSDKRVNESWTQLYDGIITNVSARSTPEGDVITITGADRGWFLVNCHVRPWVSLEVSTWETMVAKVCDSSWGLTAAIGNDVNHHIKQGRAGAARFYATPALTKPPPFQTDVGQSPADVLLHYGKIAKLLIGVVGRKVQIFKPNYARPTDYVVEAFRSTDSRRNQGNIIQADKTEDNSGDYTEVRCYSSVVAPRLEKETDNPHAGEYWGTVKHPGSCGAFNRLNAFSDGEQMGKSLCEARAEWKHQRGLFDSWTYSARVYGVSQGGLYFAPDSMIEVDDRINGVRGNYYLTAVRMACNFSSGVTSQLTIKKPRLLAG